jgi:hypothetical protein
MSSSSIISVWLGSVDEKSTVFPFPQSFLFDILPALSGSRMSSVGIETGYGLDGLGLIPGSARIFFSPQHPDRLWDPPNLLSNGYPELFPLGGKVAGV